MAGLPVVGCACTRTTPESGSQGSTTPDANRADRAPHNLSHVLRPDRCEPSSDRVAPPWLPCPTSRHGNRGQRAGAPAAGSSSAGRATDSTAGRVAVQAAVKKANRKTTLIQTRMPTAPPNAEAVTLPEMSAR